jgi:hypothetical protein
MRKKKPQVVPSENIQVMPPKLPPTIPTEHKIPTDIRILQSINDIDDRNDEYQHKQDRKNLIFLMFKFIGLGVYYKYVTDLNIK